MITLNQTKELLRILQIYKGFEFFLKRLNLYSFCLECSLFKYCILVSSDLSRSSIFYNIIPILVLKNLWLAEAKNFGDCHLES